ncbi:DUF5665 domain-containing protein [Planktotalea sp.]|uniref:DUF5665 domain-containing protein n=1 Tax=Planktotalea sp. TaxID=2029877 RepID=UPI0032985F6D
MNDDTQDRLDKLTSELETLNKHRFIRVHNSLWRLVLFQFTRGLAFGLGSVLGASILVSLLVWWLSQFEFIPIIGDFAKQLIDWIEIPGSLPRER